MVGMHKKVFISFLLAKFAPDWCFGFKQHFHCTYASNLQDIADIVDGSSDANVSQLVGTQNGEVVDDWAQLFSMHFRKVPKIKSYRHFSFTSDKPAAVLLKQYSDSSE